jgi:hypothetical protein
MNRRQQRIIHQIEAEIDNLQCVYTDESIRSGDMSAESRRIHAEMRAMEQLRTIALKTFGQH